MIAGYLATGGLIIFIVDLLDTALGRLRAEREQLNLALRAANVRTREWIGRMCAGTEPSTREPRAVRSLSPS